MTRRLRRALSLSAVAMIALASADAAFAEKPWEPEPGAGENEGPYVVIGTGPPNVYVDLVEDGFSWDRPCYTEALLKEACEHTSPTGQFRIDEGSCTPGADCHGGDDENQFRIVFYRGAQDRVPIWAPDSFFRGAGGGSQGLDLPEVDDVPREDREFINLDSQASLPVYSTISGTTRVVRQGSADAVPLKGTSITAFTPAGWGQTDLKYAGGETAAGTFSQADGSWTMKIPPGEWALKYRTPEKEPFYPGYIWSGCVIVPSSIPPPAHTPPPSGTAFLNVSGATTGVDLTVGEGQSCNGSSAPPPPKTEDPPGGNPPAGSPGPSGPSGPAGGPASISAAGVTNGKDGSVTLTLSVSGPGSISASALGKLPGGSAATSKAKGKPVTIARGSTSVKQAGSIKLVLKPTAAAKAHLKQGRKLKATAKITFTPTGGAATSTSKAVTFKPGKA